MSTRPPASNDRGTLPDSRPNWGVFRGLNDPDNTRPPPKLPDAPPWRQFPRRPAPAASGDKPAEHDYRGGIYRADPAAIEMVNAAIYLRRPLLVTGKPGAGKSTLAYAVARELGLGKVLRWNITSRTTLREGLYHYDALARLNDYNMNRGQAIGAYIDLGPLATALLPRDRPRVLLIDEIDKADIDLPNDLLNVFEEGSFEIPELARERKFAGSGPVEPEVLTSAEGDPVRLETSLIECTQFPFVLMTSNDERQFPPPFLRRCVRLYLPSPGDAMLTRIVDAHLPLNGPDDATIADLRSQRQALIADFVARGKAGDLATDQLLNAVFMTIGPNAALNAGAPETTTVTSDARRRLLDALLRHLTNDPAVDRVLETRIAQAADADPATRAADIAGDS